MNFDQGGEAGVRNGSGAVPEPIFGNFSSEAGARILSRRDGSRLQLSKNGSCRNSSGATWESVQILFFLTFPDDFF